MVNPETTTANQICVHGFCPVCGSEWWIDVDADAYKNFKDGMLVQHAFPDMPAEARELLKSGICSSCWDRLLSEEQ